jgi:hypothetical protein
MTRPPIPKPEPREKAPRTSLDRRGPIKAIPHKRRRRKADRRKVIGVYGDYHSFVSSLPCVLRGKHRCIGRVVGHHLKTVGSGGVDYANEIPCCVQAHAEMHSSEVKVSEMYNINLRAIARGLAALYSQIEAA